MTPMTVEERMLKADVVEGSIGRNLLHRVRALALPSAPPDGEALPGEVLGAARFAVICNQSAFHLCEQLGSEGVHDIGHSVGIQCVFDVCYPASFVPNVCHAKDRTTTRFRAGRRLKPHIVQRLLGLLPRHAQSYSGNFKIQLRFGLTISRI
jgi:hypothetical protein